jgi:predicted ArsR family transcriptional regulator
MKGFGEAISAIGALEDGLRRRMYLFIRDQTHPVSRDEAAEQVGISRGLAAFHLDKLVERGLLKSIYAHPEGRPSNRVGRSSKLYQPADDSVEVSVPRRRYDLIADALAEAVQSAGGEGAACAIAGRKGVALGRQAPVAAGETGLDTTVRLLKGQGFEPARVSGDDRVVLRNCPFREVAQRSPELVCRMNLAFIQGVLEGLEVRGAGAHLDPAPTRCCITLDGDQG